MVDQHFLKLLHAAAGDWSGLTVAHEVAMLEILLGRARERERLSGMGGVAESLLGVGINGHRVNKMAKGAGPESHDPLPQT